ncbi:MAG: ABC transporter permease [Verrucomicrobia bacterium]|nr:MAG: ABC transporter permease [Verrucomicrobiota bacterium]
MNAPQSKAPSFWRLLNPVLPFACIWKYRELIWQFTIRNIEMRHRGSIFGVVWSVLNPLLLLTLYVFVFGFIFGGSFGVIPNESRWNYGLGIFVGLVFFHLIAEALAFAPGVIVSQPNFVKKVVFPLEVLPIATIGASLFHMMMSLALVLVGLAIGGGTFSLGMLQLPLIIFPLTAFALGLTWLISALGVFFRDIGQLVNVVVTGLMFASAIFYSSHKIPKEAWTFLRFNPLIHFVEMARDVILWDRPIDLTVAAVLNVISLVVMTLGYAVFQRLKPAFADVI